MGSSEDMLSAAKIAEKIGITAGKVSKYLKQQGIEPDAKRGNCGYYGEDKIRTVEEALKPK